jgi:hypothetical protein
MKQYYRKNPPMKAKMSQILRDLYAEFGWKSRLAAALVGPYVAWKVRQEEKRLAQGWTYEPPTFCERNEFAEALVAKAEGLVANDEPQAVTCGR